MKFTKEMVDKYAKDLLIGLSEDENKMVLDEFSLIDEKMSLLEKRADLLDEDPISHPFVLSDAYLREDEVSDELDIDDILLNAKNKTDDEIIVPKVV